MDLRKLKKLIDLVQESGIAELEITEGEEKVKIVKGGRAMPEMVAMLPAPTAAPAGPAAAPAGAQAPAEIAPKVEGHVLKSPMVGTFYRAPSPGSKPFVEVGDTVKAGQTVCIIEAMKVMNEIKAEVEGEVVSILIENGESVEFGQPMATIRRTGTAR